MHTCGGSYVTHISDDIIEHCFAEVEKKRNLHWAATTAMPSMNIENTFLFEIVIDRKHDPEITINRQAPWGNKKRSHPTS